MLRQTPCFLLALLLAWSGLLHAQSSPAADEGAITLRPGDIVRVTVWREEDLSGDFPVDENGVVTFPLLGDRKVTEVPMRQLRPVLLGEYRAQLRNPSIYITPLRRISVLGEVRTPNVYLVDPTVMLASAIALAGGVTPDGDPSRIRIVRAGRTLSENLTAEHTLVNVDVRSGDQIYIEKRLVEREGWLQRNGSYLMSTGTSIVLFLLALALK